MQDVAGQGRTVLFVSHNMAAVRTLCQNGIWLENGRKIQSGRASEIVSAYEDKMMSLVDDSSTVAERSHKETKGLTFYFKRLEVLNANGHPTNKFKYNETLILNVEFGGKLDSGVFSTEFHLYNLSQLQIPDLSISKFQHPFILTSSGFSGRSLLVLRAF